MEFPKAKRSLKDIATAKNLFEFLAQTSIFTLFGVGLAFIAHTV